MRKRDALHSACLAAICAFALAASMHAAHSGSTAGLICAVLSAYLLALISALQLVRKRKPAPPTQGAPQPTENAQPADTSAHAAHGDSLKMPGQSGNQQAETPDTDDLTSPVQRHAPAHISTAEAAVPTSTATAAAEAAVPTPAAAHPLTEEPPAAVGTPAVVPSVSHLDFDALSEALVASDDPLDVLKRFVGDIRTREAEASPGHDESPCDLERYAARLLDEAGLFDHDVKLPPLDVVRPHASQMVYLRVRDRRVPYQAYLRVLRLEAALNALRFAAATLEPDASLQDAYRLNQSLARSIAAQHLPVASDDLIAGDGEWAVRYGISQAIESLQLPFRLTADYRCNVADGNVALEFAYTPADAFARSAHLDGLGIVPTTGDMRQRAAADYALRLAILLAACAFRCSPRIRHVWVAAVHDTASSHTCYLSVDFDCWRFGRLKLSDLGDLSETYRQFAPVLRYEDGWLRPVRQGFHLDEERFCPSRRYLPVSLSSRRLEGALAARLGCDHVSGLSIEEADGRVLVAGAIMAHLTPGNEEHATQKNVHTIMELAGDDPDPSVRSAAERVSYRLIDGTLDADPFAIGEEFVRGDALTRGLDRAKELLMGRHPDQALSVVAPLLRHIDEADTYADSKSIVYRYFGSYIERALYNRLMAPQDRRSVLLVPDAYYEALLLASMSALVQGQGEQALAYADHLCVLAPLDARCHLQRVQCLELLGRDDEAAQTLTQLLEWAHDPLSVGMAYYRMASFQWKRNNLAAAQACYVLAMQHLPAAVPMIAMELSVLYLQHPGELTQELSREQAEEILASHSIPVAPTQETSDAFLECAQASLDAEIFPVARNFAHVLGAFSGDDIIWGLVRSLEDAPDH